MSYMWVVFFPVAIGWKMAWSRFLASKCISRRPMHVASRSDYWLTNCKSTWKNSVTVNVDEISGFQTGNRAVMWSTGISTRWRDVSGLIWFDVTPMPPVRRVFCAWQNVFHATELVQTALSPIGLPWMSAVYSHNTLIKMNYTVTLYLCSKRAQSPLTSTRVCKCC